VIWEVAAKRQWGQRSERDILRNLVVLASLVAIHHRPEVVLHIVEHHLPLVENFPTSRDRLLILLRDYWARAPVNGGSKDVCQVTVQESWKIGKSAISKR
jgi:hypothetical protein